jgi:hypothetical protein
MPVATAPAPALAPAPPRPVDLKAVQDALMAPGLVTIAPLTFNQLIIELAKFLKTQVDDVVFTDHKQTITANYITIYNDVHKALGPAPATSEIAAPPPKKAAALVKNPAQKHHDSDSEEVKSDGSESGSDYEMSDKASTGASLASEPASRITFTLSKTSLNNTNIDGTSGRPKRAAAANVNYSAFMNSDNR